MNDGDNGRGRARLTRVVIWVLDTCEYHKVFTIASGLEVIRSILDNHDRYQQSRIFRHFTNIGHQAVPPSFLEVIATHVS